MWWRILQMGVLLRSLGTRFCRRGAFRGFLDRMRLTGGSRPRGRSRRCFFPYLEEERMRARRSSEKSRSWSFWAIPRTTGLPAWRRKKKNLPEAVFEGLRDQFHVRCGAYTTSTCGSFVWRNGGSPNQASAGCVCSSATIPGSTDSRIRRCGNGSSSFRSDLD